MTDDLIEALGPQAIGKGSLNGRLVVRVLPFTSINGKKVCHRPF